ncbi:phosphate ABC transporter substrate-binding protein [Gloeothece verrucosa]|uniref:ABC-type phosphate transport system periplasmic component-like protein n=1 Tax=Gloeothece verrucosa (strain PCC 7822) TaxID=497965 RepID=E0UEX6_GLOV7|nr:phosphate ABC transporter substrate-binding protein [Gloeothece verrucosa]ADN13106.1 ABC-type phosphate transport system periplasmic component-like protein [Gloeothece verrucosa PCC 7822]
MSRNNEAPILILSLLITGAILGGGYWWFSRQSGTNPIGSLLPQSEKTSTQSPPAAASDAQLPSPPSPAAFPPPTTVASGTTVRINGSTSMAQINKALKDNFEQSFPQTKVEINAQGSDQGVEMLVNRQIDIAAVSRPLHHEEKAQGLIAVPVTQDAIAIIVGDKNPFRKGLTQNQVADIFQGKITDWSAVGGTPGTIRVFNRPATSGTRQAFEELLLKGSNFGTTPNITMMPRDATTPIIQALGTDGISYATYAQVDNQKTARTVALDGLTPEAANYPLQRTLYYVYKDPPSEAVQAFLGYATAPIGRQVIASTNQ